MSDRTYYQALNVPEKASSAEIRSSYLLLSRVVHPDRFDRTQQGAEWEKANELLRDLNEAYGVLRDPARRRAYDERLRQLRADEQTGGDTPEGPEPDPTDAHARGGSAGGGGRINAETLNASKLPHEIASRLRRRLQEPSADCFVVKAPNVLPMVLGCLAGIALVAGVIWAANDYRWSIWQRAAYSLVTIGGAGLFFWSAGLLSAWLSTPIRPGQFVTSMYIVRTRLDGVYFRWLWGFDDFRAVHKHKDGSYQSSTFTFTYGSAKEVLRISSRSEAERFVEFLRSSQQEIRDYIEGGDYEALARRDDLLGITREHVGAAPNWYTQRLGVAILAAGVLAAIMGPILLTPLNEYHDDRLSWQAAAQAQTASGYRLYMHSHPQGRWRAEATAALDGLYEKADARYSDVVRLSNDHDAEAVAAFRSLLQAARITGNFDVPILFVGESELPAGLETRLARVHGVTVLPIGDAFSPSRMQARESRILDQVRAAVRAVIPEDVLDLRLGIERASAQLEVRYEVRESDSLYYNVKQEKMPESLRSYYPGIRFDWQFEIREPNGGNVRYQFVLESSPAPQFKSEYSNVYDGMADSAFQGLRDAVLNRLGLSRGSGPQF